MNLGSCLCGAVKFTVDGELKAPDACHCTQCRKFSGHFSVSTDVSRKNLGIIGKEHITWYFSSAKVRRGFCSICGSALFFDPLAKDWIGIHMGAFDGITGVHTELHVYTAEKGDYYDIADGLPTYPTIPD